MQKIGFIVDSFSCLTEKEANQLGFGYLPFRIELDDKTYDDGIEISKKDLLEKIGQANKVKTSLPRLDVVQEVLEKMTQEYEVVVYLPISEKLSGAYNAVNNFKSEYPNLYIMPNRFVGIQYIKAIEFIKSEYEKGQTLDQITGYINEILNQTATFILPHSLNFAINGGRISGLKKFALKVLSKMKLMPFIRFYLDENSMAGIARGVKGAIKQIIEKAIGLTKTKSIQELNEKYFINFIYGIDETFNQDIKKIIDESGLIIEHSELNTSVIAAHTGPQAIAISLMPKVK
ncbi:DegV family protein [Mycoplasmopsis iners]|uniref:DegV family protein n=1 Tax=Mycoplasmopsis iners TaxID=76630 RepID=UPI000497F6A1|nr:DegV family protein [Mycoplasmopsis iners]